MVIDDLMLSNDKDTVELIIFGSHHKNISLFYVTQNLFLNDQLYRTMSINSRYFVIFNNKRDSCQIHTFARQVFFGKEKNRILNAYKRANKQMFGFIVLTFVEDISDKLIVVTDWWELCPSVYL